MARPAHTTSRADALVLLGCGGRQLAWPPARVRAELEALVDGRPVLQLFHGGARGADRAVGQAATALGWRVLEVPAPWARYGYRAGPLRNALMLGQAITAAKAASRPGLRVRVGVIAFPGGRGTAHMIRLARAAAPAGWVGLAVIRG